MGLGDSINSLATGYQRGQAQYAANEDARQKAAQAGAKAAQEAAEFRLKLATHSQALTNSAEAEYNAITAAITSENWDPAYLPAISARVANFDKTYYATGTWKGGSAAEMLQNALHLNPVKAEGALDKGQVVPQVEQPEADSPMWGFASQGQKDAADEKARKARSAEAARSMTLQAAESLRKKYGGLPPDESKFMAEWYNYQDQMVAAGGGDLDLGVLDEATDIWRENGAAYYAAVVRDMDKIKGSNELSVKIAEKTEATRKAVSTLITSLLQFDQNEGGVMGDTFFAQRTPIRLAMEADNNRWSAYMEPNQLISNLITKYSNIEGGLNLDPKSAPWVGALTIAGLPPEGLRALNKFYDSGVAPNPSMTNPVYVNGVLGMIDYSNPSKQWKIWEGSPTTEAQTPPGADGATAGAPAAGEPPAVTAKPSQPMPGKAVLPGQAGKIAERASIANRSAKVAADYASAKAKIDADAQAKRDEGAAKVAMRLGGREWAMSNISESMGPVQVESAIVKHIEDVLRQTGFQGPASGSFGQQAQRLYESVKDRVVPADTYQETAALILEAALGKAKK
jgi:hypothetical protein